MDKRYIYLWTHLSLQNNVQKVYYVACLISRKDKQGWCVAIKTKLRGFIEALMMLRWCSLPIDEISHVNEVTKVEDILEFQHSHC